MSKNELAIHDVVTITTKVNRTPVLYFNPFQAPEYDSRSIDIDEIRPGQVIAVENQQLAYSHSEVGTAVPVIALGRDTRNETLYALDYEGEFQRIDPKYDTPRLFDLGQSVLLSPLSRDRAKATWQLLKGDSTDPLCIALQSIALHYATSDVDLRNIS